MEQQDVECVEDVEKRLRALQCSHKWNKTSINPGFGDGKNATREKLKEMKLPPKSIDEASNLNESSWS